MTRHLCQAVAILIVGIAAFCSAQVDQPAVLSAVDQQIVLSAVACEGHSLVLLCPLGFLIRVTGGLHGRLDFTTCASGANGTTEETCISEDDTEGEVGRECDGRNFCQHKPNVPVSGNCTDISTYFSVEYECNWPTEKHTACEKEWLTLGCPDDKVMKVQGVTYGRTGTDDDECTSPSAGNSVTCNSTTALKLATDVCDGMEDCTLDVSSAALGACYGKGKLALTVSLSCITCQNTRSDAYCAKKVMKGVCASDPSWTTINCLKSCLRCDSHKFCNNSKGDEICSRLAGQNQCSNPIVARNCEKSCSKCRDSEAPSTFMPILFTPTTQPPACVNEGDESFCHNAAVLGECEEGDSIIMLQKCYRSCSKCNATACEDLLEYCPTMASKGECAQQEVFKKCPVSCNGTCNLADLAPDRDMECTNNHKDDNNCDFWAMTGECDINTYWMRKNCYKSCTKCHEPDICKNHNNNNKCDRGAAQNKCSDKGFSHECPRACGRCPKANSTETDNAKCVNLHSSDSDCSYWALLGECDVNPDWMTMNCFKACRDCLTENSTTCENARLDASCDYWLSFGECESNAAWMAIYCYKTCSYCDLPACANRRGDVKCTHWASIGECEMNPEWMHVNCEAACRKCDEHRNETLLCEAMWNATHANETLDSTAMTTVMTTSNPLEMTTVFSNMTECEMGAAEGNCTVEEFALLCPEECYNLTCNDTGLIYEHPVLRYYDTPELNYGSSTCDGDLWVVCPPSYIVNVTSLEFWAKDKEYCEKKETARRMQEEWWVVEQEMKGKKKKDSFPGDPGPPCEDPTLFDLLKDQCDGKSWCHFNLSATNYTQTCPDETSRFLNVSFTCKEPVFHGQACEGVRMKLVCWSYQVLQIHNATFGRQDEDTCPVEEGSRLHTNRTCSNPHAKKLVSELCNYNNTCSMDTSAILFGDPCPDIAKYLTVDFSCIECKNSHKSDFHCEYWAHKGECEKNPEWMLAYCRRSCTRCHAVESCNNTYHDSHKCNYWASIGECKRNPDWMIEKCQRSCNRCPDDFVIPTPEDWPPINYPNSSREDSYDSFYLEHYVTRRWNKNYVDHKYEETRILVEMVNQTFWKYYSEVYPDTFESLSYIYFRKSQITPWVIVGYYITFNYNVTEAEAVDIECVIIDRDNGTLFFDNETMIVSFNDTKKTCNRRQGYCMFNAPFLRKGTGEFYCRCTGQWAGARCNDLPLWGKLVLGTGGFLLVLIIIIIVIYKKRHRRPPPEDKAELVDAAHIDTVSVNSKTDLKGVSEMEYGPEVEHRPVTPDLLHNRKMKTRLPLSRSSAEDKKELRLQENEEEGTTNL